MGRVADQQQARTVPLAQAARLDGEQRELLPGLEMLHPIGEFRCHCGDGSPERWETGGAQARVAAFGNDVAHLPALAVLHEHQEAAMAQAEDGAGLRRVLEATWEIEPEDIER